MPNRGLIYDRNGYLLATNSYDYRVGISPNRSMDRQDIARELAPLIGMPEDELYRADWAGRQWQVSPVGAALVTGGF